MSLKRRDFIRLSAGSSLVYGLSSFTSLPKTAAAKLSTPAAEAAPITTAERLTRIAKAQQLMAEHKIDALVLDAGTTALEYFTGVRWWPSERTMVAIIPANGELTYISPAFEEERLRQLMTIGKTVHTWQEHESPYQRIAGALNDAGMKNGTVGIEERLRFFIFDGIRKEAAHLNYVSGDAVTIPCRLIKSSAEIALLQQANDTTVAAYKIGISRLHEGMTPADFSAITAQAHQQLGASGDIDVNFGKASAYPHGSIEPQHLKKGDMVLMDGGCKVHGYTSDISRSIVFDAVPTKRQLDIWNLEKKAQAAGFAAAKIGDPCENVDIAARKVLTDAGFGPGYKIPGCPHRTGHGIGMDGHEWGNMVLGNKLPLQAGMCFSIEPTIAIYGEFGVRLEDCAYMTPGGPKWFSEPSPSINKPFA